MRLLLIADEEGKLLHLTDKLKLLLPVSQFASAGREIIIQLLLAILDPLFLEVYPKTLRFLVAAADLRLGQGLSPGSL